MNKLWYKQKISHTNQKVCKLSFNISNKLIDANPIGTTCETTSPPRSCWMKGALVHLLSQSFFEMTHSFHVFLSNIPSIEWPNVKAEREKKWIPAYTLAIFHCQSFGIDGLFRFSRHFFEELTVNRQRSLSIVIWSQRTSSHARLLVPMIWALKKKKKQLEWKSLIVFMKLGELVTRTEIPAQ